jgi:rhodanese-related sulfurtransferase
MFVRVNPQQARALIEAGTVEVIDVRDPSEWSRGHIPGARLIELSTIRNDPRGNLPREGVLFVCAGGVRSQTAARIAVEHGLKRVFSLTGGTQSWMKAGFELANELSVAV